MADPDTRRIFIGVPVDARAQGHVNRLVAPLIRTYPRLRWVPEANRHLTLAFLGEIPLPVVGKLSGTFDETYRRAGSSRLELDSLRRFPNRRSGIIALTGAADGSLENLFQITSGLLCDMQLEVERKMFLPHVTVARTGRKERSRVKIDQPANIVLKVSSVVLYQSTLTETGAQYTVLKETRLVQGG